MPNAGVYFLTDATVDHDFDGAVGARHIQQHAGVVSRVPHFQAAKILPCPLSWRHTLQNRHGFHIRFNHKANLSHVFGLRFSYHALQAHQSGFRKPFFDAPNGQTPVLP